MKRLADTRNIFRAKLQTSTNLLRRIDSQITEDDKVLSRIRGSILRASRESTLKKIKIKLAATAKLMGYPPPKKADREYLLRKIRRYKEQNSFLRYAAIHESVIYLCVIYEDLVRRVIMKYYEEDIRRLMSDKEGLKNRQLIEALLRGDNVHRALAEGVVDEILYGSIDKWCNHLQKMSMNFSIHPLVKELFLIRNCLVHNNNRVSSQLHTAFPETYKLRSAIKLSIDNANAYTQAVYSSTAHIFHEYNRLFPKNRGTWLQSTIEKQKA